MTVHQLHAGFILRLRQRLSRLSYELRDVRTGQARVFDDTQALARFLDDTATAACGTPAASSTEAAGLPWNDPGTPPRQAGTVDERT